MFVERNEDPNPKSPYTMFPRPGKREFAQLPAKPVIGGWANKSNVYYVSGGEVYELFEDQTSKHLGTVAVGSNPATMRANGNQLLICSGGNVYIATGFALYQPIVNYARGVANINGNVVTLTPTGNINDFSDTQIGDLFMAPPDANGNGSTKVFIVTQVVSPTEIVLNAAVGIFNNYAFQVGTEMLTGVMPEFVDGYFIVNVPNSKTFRISNNEDGTIWDELDQGTKQGSVDNIAAVKRWMGYLVLMGDTNSAEVWGDSGNANFPFARVSGQTLNAGTAAAWSVATLTDGTVVWLLSSDEGENQIVKSNGGAPTRISNHALEYAMERYPLVYDAITSTYLEDGHEHVRIDFPTANRTWDYDNTEGIWVELGVYTPEDEVYGCDIGRYRVHVTWPSGKRMNLVGDYTSGKIFEVSTEFLDDAGVDFPVMRIAPHINTNLTPAVDDAFALDCELGTIPAGSVGEDGKPLIPTVELSYSNDGAKTWSQPRVASLGRAGEYEGTVLTPDESFDANPLSQTNPQTFEARPLWSGLGRFWIARTLKIKSTGRYLRAVFNGLTGVEAEATQQQ